MTPPWQSIPTFRHQILGGGYTQTVSLTHHSPQLDFDTQLDHDFSHPASPVKQYP